MDDAAARSAPEPRPPGATDWRPERFLDPGKGSAEDLEDVLRFERTQHEGEAKGKRQHSFFAELPVLVIIAFVLALLLKTFLVQAFYIPSSSMEPTLEVGDRVLVNKISYTFREPRRGEVVVFTERSGDESERDEGSFRRFMNSMSAGLGFARSDERDFIKRIIGLPGETIEMRDGTVYVDGEPVPEESALEGGYLSAPDQQPFGPVEVPEGHYFMMGDNRPNSADSRYSMGTIPREDILGRAFVVIWPLGRLDTLPIAAYGPATTATAAVWPPLAAAVSK